MTEFSLLVAGNGPVGDLGWALGDHHLVGDLASALRLGAPTGSALGSAGPQALTSSRLRAPRPWTKSD